MDRGHKTALLPQDTTVKFLQASFQGWPSPNGIGIIDKTAWDQTVKIAEQTKNEDGDTVLTEAPEGLAYTNDYAQKALDALKASGYADVTGTDFKPMTVKLNPGGA